MKVMVVFHLPEGAGLLHCLLSDLALVPAVKSTYVFDNKVFEVTRPIEILGRRLDGSRKGSNETLLELLAAVSPMSPDSALVKAAKMRNVGEPEEDGNEKSPSGLIVRAAAMFKEVDRIVVLDMKYVATLHPVSEESLMRGVSALAAAPTDGS